MAIAAGIRNIVLRREDTFIADLTFTTINDDNGVRTPLNLSDYEIKSEGRYTNTNTKWFDTPITITDAANGKLQIKFSSANTRTLYDTSLSPNGTYDVQIKHNVSGEVATVLGGSVTIINDVTEDVPRPTGVTI